MPRPERESTVTPFGPVGKHLVPSDVGVPGRIAARFNVLEVGVMDSPRSRRRLRTVAAVAFASPLLLTCGDDPTDPGRPAPEVLPIAEQVRLPPGFRIEEFARVTRPRSLALGDRGTVFVGTYYFTKGVTSPVWALPDADRDYTPDGVIEIAKGWGTPNGVDFHDGSLFVVDEDRVFRLDEVETRLQAAVPVLIYSDLPSRAETEEATHLGHWWRYLRYGPDDRVYVSVGTRWSLEVGAHSLNDAVDQPRYSSIVSMSPDGSDFRVFATGVRNSMGMDFHPVTGELWFTDNGSSWPFSDPDFYDVPPDELNRATKPGQHFGFPWLHGRLPDPVSGGAAPAGTIPPVHEFAAHSATLGARFYTGSSFPARYHGALFVAEHGTEATTPIRTLDNVHGDRISVVFLDADGDPERYEVFADGFLTGTNATYSRRPVDLLILDDGSLLVSDDQAGAIYRIWYEG